MASGVLVIDKPSGPTSHDVVARLRRALGTRRIGHAGTLDPMASGVLVVLVGEATKLAPYLTAEDKRYEARVALGAATDTLDAEGEVTATGEVPGWLVAEIAEVAAGGAAPRLAEVLAAEAARRAQVPPVYSAIHVGGRRSHALARAGAAVELEARPVEVRSIAIAGATADPPALALAIDVTKGYYVRSLARDLGARLGVPAHLAALRRTASGGFVIAEAAPPDAGREALGAAMLPVEEAARRSLPVATLTGAGALRAARGQPLGAGDFVAAPEGAGPSAWLDGDGRLIAVGAPAAGGFSVLRGFAGSSTAGGAA